MWSERSRWEIDRADAVSTDSSRRRRFLAGLSARRYRSPGETERGSPPESGEWPVVPSGESIAADEVR